jgi:hypothetical protein
VLGAADSSLRDARLAVAHMVPQKPKYLTLPLFVDAIVKMLSNKKLPQLRRLSIFSSSGSDGSVRIPIRELNRLEKHHNAAAIGGRGIECLIIQCDPGDCPEVAELIRMVGPSLVTIGLLRGCSKWIKTSSEMIEFLKTIPNASNLYLGICNVNVDMDEVVPGHVFASTSTTKNRYIQYANASASIETLKLIQEIFIDCEFDGIGFLSFLL